MNDDLITVWHNKSPLLIHPAIADQFGVTARQQLTDEVLVASIIQANDARTGAACGWQPGQPECGTCSA